MQNAPDKNWFDKALEQLQLGESLISGGVDGLYRGWKVSAEALGKLCTDTDRWQAVVREMRATVSLADILRSRTAS
jgi:hypothetical protein